jgi:MoaA/NifB/PqqE/SkfB family radical SAM enzyme
VSVLLTGKGEPLLFPDMISEYLEHLNFRFPLVDLQTNGIRVLALTDNIKRWHDDGLSLVCISIAHQNAMQSNQLMGIEYPRFNYWRTVDRLHDIGMPVRLNCTLLNSGVNQVADVEALIEKCHSHGVEQLTIREVELPNVSIYSPEAHEVREHVMREKPHNLIDMVAGWMVHEGATTLLRLPHGAIVYDFKGQNVCLSNCLTSVTDPNDIRQIIFFPDGRVMYDWKYEGARLL